MASDLSQIAGPTGTQVGQWRDKKRYLWLMGLIVPTAVLVILPIVWALNQFGWHVAAQLPFWIGPILVYIVLPLLDRKYGPDGENPECDHKTKAEKDGLRHDAILERRVSHR